MADPDADAQNTGVPAPGPAPDPGYTSSGVPTFESVREKIETRYGTSTGAVELESETVAARRAQQQYEARQQAAAERLEEIRASMHDQDRRDQAEAGEDKPGEDNAGEDKAGEDEAEDSDADPDPEGNTADDTGENDSSGTA